MLVPGLLFSETYDQLALHSIPTTVNLFECVSLSKATIYSATSFIFIPTYRFIVYPLTGKYIPSLLKMIGVGLSLSLLSTMISLAIDSIGHFYSNVSHCIFDDNTATVTISIPIYWVLLIYVVNGFGLLLIVCSILELEIAQTPNRMRGIMMVLVLVMGTAGALANYLLTVVLHHFPAATPSCVFYYYHYSCC